MRQHLTAMSCGIVLGAALASVGFAETANATTHKGDGHLHRQHHARTDHRDGHLRRQVLRRHYDARRHYDVRRQDVRRYAGSGGATTSRTCLTPAARNLLDRIESRFGRVQIVSTCRPGAVIAGTNHPSMHRYGMAIDFNAPAGRKAEVVRWLAANNSGGTMTYANMNHIHADVGRYHFVSLGSGGGGSSHYTYRRGRQLAVLSTRRRRAISDGWTYAGSILHRDD